MCVLLDSWVVLCARASLGGVLFCWCRAAIDHGDRSRRAKYVCFDIFILIVELSSTLGEDEEKKHQVRWL